MNWKQELGNQIKGARESAGLTQSELAIQLDVSRQMLSRYEAGRAAPAVDVLVEIARALEIEFQVKGILVRFEHGAGRSRLLHRQFKLEFEKARKFDRAHIEITPTEGMLVIKAEIPA
jgi:transcriptional regulator with XRE-family HTH domain